VCVCVCVAPQGKSNTVALVFSFCGAAAQHGPWPPHSWGF